MKKCALLFWEMFKISLFVVGGGFAIIAVADEVFSKKRKWTEEGEIVDALPLFQMVPGIIAGGTGVYVGRKIAGLPGAVAAVVGVFLPSVIVFSAVSAGYSLILIGNALLDAAFLGLRASMTGIIAAMVVRSWRKSAAGAAEVAAIAAALVAMGYFRVNPAVVIFAAAAVGVAAKFAGGGRPPAEAGGTEQVLEGKTRAEADGAKGACGRVAAKRGGRKFRSVVWAIPLIFLKYGAIAFGGGYVLVPVYIADFVGKAAPYLQLSGREFADVMALTQMTPGPISVNCATFFGYRMGMGEFASPVAGIACAVLATVCLFAPGTILLYLALGSIDRFRSSRVVQGILAGVKPVTVAMMLNALWAFASMSAWTHIDGGGVAFHPVAAALAVAAGVAVYTKRLGAVAVIFLSAALSLSAEVLVKYAL